MWQSARPDTPFVTAASSLARLTGNKDMEQVIDGHLSMEAYIQSWLPDLIAFNKLRQPYLLYPVQRFVP